MKIVVLATFKENAREARHRAACLSSKRSGKPKQEESKFKATLDHRVT